MRSGSSASVCSPRPHTPSGSRSAAVLYELLLPYGDRVAVGYPEISTGAVARYLGLLAASMERWNSAERHFDDALKINTRIGAHPWLAHTQHDYARMLLPCATTDREKALELLAEALATYRDLGMSLPPDFARRSRRQPAGPWQGRVVPSSKE